MSDWTWEGWRCCSCCWGRGMLIVNVNCRTSHYRNIWNELWKRQTTPISIYVMIRQKRSSPLYRLCQGVQSTLFFTHKSTPTKYKNKIFFVVKSNIEPSVAYLTWETLITLCNIFNDIYNNILKIISRIYYITLLLSFPIATK